MLRHLPAGQLQGSCACSCHSVSITFTASTGHFLHESPAEERDKNHRQPGGHLRESPSSIAKRNSKTVLLEETVEGVEDALVRRNGVNLFVNNKFLERLGGSRGAVQGLVAELRDGCRLISQWLGDAELDQRRCADRPRVAENVLLFAIDKAKLGRGGLRGNDRYGGLILSAI